MKKNLLLFLALAWMNPIFAQTNLITFDYEKNSFNDNFPIPAEKYFAITGQISKKVSMVEIIILKDVQNPKSILHSNLWKRSFDQEATQFYVPISYKLRGNEEYDFMVNYYRLATNTEIQNAKNDLFGALDAYIEQSLAAGKKNLALSSNSYQIVSDLNSLVKEALTYYRSAANLQFEGFSDLVKNKIRQVEKYQAGNAKGLLLNKSKKENMLAIRTQYLQELGALIHNEVSFLFNSGLSVIGDNKRIENVVTEKTQNFLTLHAGYGGSYLNENDVTFASGLHAGITLPLGNRALGKTFWKRSAIIAGVFFNNFDLNGTEVTGPVVSRPIYAGLGYKLFHFVRLTGGVTALEKTNLLNNEKEIYFRPFIGIVADIDLWFNLRK